MTARMEWVNREAALRIRNVGKDRLRQLVKSGQVQTRQTGRNHRNGEPENEYWLAVPEDFVTTQPVETPLPLLAPLSHATSQAQLASGGNAPVHYTPEQQAEADERARIVAPMFDFAEGRLRGFRNLKEVAEWIGSRYWLSEERRWKRGHSPKNIYALYCKLKRAKRDASALARKPRADRGQSRTANKFPKLPKLVVAKWIETGNTAHVCDIVLRLWGGPQLPYKDAPPPSRAAIETIIKAIPESVRDVARLPKQQADAKHAPYFVTGRGEWTRPNQCWVADHRLRDILLVNDVFPQEKLGAAVRVWETVIQDMRTRVIVGAAYSANPSWRPIASALQQGISRFGKPEIFYVDNGKDFRKVGEGAGRGSLLKPSQYKAPRELDDEGRVPFSTGLLARLDIKVCYCTPRHPQAKQIESYFNFVSGRFDAMFFRRGYIGSKPGTRTEDCGEKPHTDFLAGRRSTTPLVSVSKFIPMASQWIREFNEAHRHSGRGMDGQTPLQVMNTLLPLDQRQIPDMLALAPLFWDVQLRKVSNCKVEIDNRTYSPALDDPQSQQEMYFANGSEVAVHRDPADVTRALVFENKPSGMLLAKLVCDELLAHAPLSADDVEAMSRQRARQRRASREAIAAFTFGIPTEVEQLAERAATGTDGRALVQRAQHARPRGHLQPAIVSDAVAEDADKWKKWRGE